MSSIRERNESINVSGKEDSEWIVCDDDLYTSEADNNPAMSQSYIDIGTTASPLFFVPYSPELEIPDVDRSLDINVPMLASPGEDELNNDIKQAEDEEIQESNATMEEDVDAKVYQPVPWWKRLGAVNGLGLAAVAVGAASVLAIAATRSSHK